MTTETAGTAAVVGGAFETTTCRRCAGSGRYSYCQMYGDVCFGCRGQKVVLTKRGAAARAFYEASLPRKRPVDLLIGERFLSAGQVLTVVAAPVQSKSSRKSGDTWVPYVDVETVNRRGQGSLNGLVPDSLVAVIPSPAELAQLKAAALAYQATLTETGKPRRRGGK